ncbi:MAG: sel1 repeat family protein [Rhodobacteraceae bacterium]|nr:sel1 repeat family protein [Paracoccaceae bacterium]
MRRAFCLLACLAAAPALAETSEFGTTNPEEMTMNRLLENVENGRVDMTTCAAGYLMTKSGRHAIARETFEACAAAGYTQAMTWMSYMDQNGLGADFDPDRAAAWDRRAAEAGDPVGKYNYGVSLMRGFGVAQDEAAGRRLIDEAAAAGLPIARRVRAAGYDLDEATPDADNWRYAPAF